MKRSQLLGALILLLQTTTAWSHILTMEPDDFAAGTDVSEAWAEHGIHLSALRVGATPSPVYVQEETLQPAVTGTRLFYSTPAPAPATGWGALNELPRCYYEPTWPCSSVGAGNSALRIDFDNGVDFIEVFGAYSVDELGMILLDINGQALPGGRYVWSDELSTDGRWNYASATASRETPDIYGVLIGGVIGSSSIDAIRVNVAEPVNVPEPGTLALLGVGLLVSTAMRRQRREKGTREKGTDLFTDPRQKSAAK